jgi:hypothetical protein
MGQQRIRMGLFGAATALGVVLVLLVLRPQVDPIRRAVSILMGRANPAEAGANFSAGGTNAVAKGERSRLADDLNSPGGDVRTDLRLVNRIFIAYRQALHTGNPVGENAEITAALTGRNKIAFAFIPADNPAINSKGELCDRWGMPYFFHQLSGEKMEIRSAGPDRRLWTDDDEVLTP